MEDFLYDLYNICYELLPFFGILVLVVLFVALIKLISVLSNVNKVLKKADPSLELVEKTLEKVQAPVDTVVRVSKSVDKACDASAKVIEETKQYVSKSITALKGKVNDLIKEENKKVNTIDNETIVEEGE